METLHDTCREVGSHLREVREVADELGLGFLGMGFQPKWRRDEMPWMPKGRYRIMREYMPKVGTLGLDMMTRTCTVQVNLDYASEADMVKKFRVSLALQPVATALFADSPFTDGKPNGYLSYRSHIWTDTDRDGYRHGNSHGNSHGNDYDAANDLCLACLQRARRHDRVDGYRG